MSEAEATARRAANSKAMDRLARFGLICRGTLYGLIGVLAVQITLGHSGREADKSGAIRTVSDLPFGAVVLWAMAVGFAALTIWQLSEVFFGSRRAKDRVQGVSRVVVYAFVCFSLLTVLLAGRARSDDRQSQDVTAKLLGIPGGQFIVGAIGLGILALGFYWIRQGVTKDFRKYLGPMPPRARTVMDKLGLAGYVVRGLVAGLAGVFVVEAAITFDPGKAGGIDQTLRAFARTPAGPWLLAVVAMGVVLFACYCFGEARWRRT
ncbi:DUF1206 domain-containing protein [Nonomuraea sediminis]|uniref:DUF1206 domain-containing protein n=1 Tax=Nonomuraea sediminis TaxID=2835864 RepID=UPI0027E0036B|nr:DUF1206 domain-containing protein [Nonomuraea sediminis]